MNSIAAIYDIHGNLPALKAVWEELSNEKVDRVVVGGDVIPGPMAIECLDFLSKQQFPISFILGNTDQETAEQARNHDTERFQSLNKTVQSQIRWCADRLSAQQLAEIEKWPLKLRLNLKSFGDITFCHATTHDNTSIVTSRSSANSLDSQFQSSHSQLFVCGHTHMQFDRSVGNKRIVNAGSVGMPFGQPGAYWLLISDQIRFRHTNYDLESAANAIKASDYPDSENFARTSVLAPASEATMLDLFDSQ